MQLISSVGRLSGYRPQNPSSLSGYEQLSLEYNQSGFTYKSNQIIHKISESSPRNYPYQLLLYITKLFHLNQFQIIFFSHILNDVQPCYNSQPELFNQQIQIRAQVADIIDVLLQRQNRRNSYHNSMQQFNLMIKGEEGTIKREEEEYQLQGNQDKYRTNFTAQELRRIYSYLLVLGYAVKYYLNEQLIIKPYDEQIKLRHPTFFASIFNKWAKKYGNSALATTPRRINSYYQTMAAQLQVQENINNSNNEENCQYRNYNQIVQELIKATTDGDQGNQAEKEGNSQ